MLTLPHAPAPLLADDYSTALVHLAWIREDQRRVLLFGLVELFPAEMPSPEETEETGLAFKLRKRQHHIYVRRIKMSCKDALAWYDDCSRGQVILDNGDDCKVKLEVRVLGEEPPWPHLLTTHQLPFQSWGTVRAHHLLQVSPPPSAKLPLDNPKAADWLTDRLFFNFHEHPEWLGSVSLVAPNPVLRSVHRRLAVEGDKEFSDIHLIARSGHDVRNLTLYLGEHRHGGMASFRPIKMEGPYCRYPHIGRTEQISLIVACPHRGVLEWCDPTGYVRGFKFQGYVSGSEKQVQVPDTRGRTGETYKRQLMEPAFESVLGSTDREEATATHLRVAQHDRKRREEVKRSGQRLFWNEPDGTAQEFIRELIGKANKRVWIVDPYSATNELFTFALATSSSQVDAKIITSAEHLRNPDKINPEKEAGEALLDQLDNLPTSIGRFDVMVMSGKRSPIHDRFLVIDDAVWLSGSSLNSLGERASVMIKLPGPEQILKLINAELKNCGVPLEEWVKKRKSAKNGNDRQDISQ